MRKRKRDENADRNANDIVVEYYDLPKCAYCGAINCFKSAFRDQTSGNYTRDVLETGELCCTSCGEFVSSDSLLYIKNRVEKTRHQHHVENYKGKYDRESHVMERIRQYLGREPKIPNSDVEIIRNVYKEHWIRRTIVNLLGKSEKEPESESKPESERIPLRTKSQVREILRRIDKINWDKENVYFELKKKNNIEKYKEIRDSILSTYPDPSFEWAKMDLKYANQPVGSESYSEDEKKYFESKKEYEQKNVEIEQEIKKKKTEKKYFCKKYLEKWKTIIHLLKDENIDKEEIRISEDDLKIAGNRFDRLNWAWNLMQPPKMKYKMEEEYVFTKRKHFPNFNFIFRKCFEYYNIKYDPNDWPIPKGTKCLNELNEYYNVLVTFLKEKEEEKEEKSKE